MRLAIVVLLGGCGRLGFDTAPVTDNPDAPSSDLAIGSPPPNSDVGETTELTGSCRVGVPITLSGAGLASPDGTSCANGEFSVVITFTDGPGEKIIVVTQGAESVSRTFIRITPPNTVITHRASATGTAQSAGFTVDCNLLVPRPPGVEPGDLLLGMIYTDGGLGGSVATPGFTRLLLDDGVVVAFFKIAAIEPDGYSFPIVAGEGASDTCESAGVLSAFVGVNTLEPIQAQRAGGNDAATTFGPGGVTAEAATMLVGAWGSNGPATGIEPPANMTTGGNASSDGGFANALIVFQSINAGATGERFATITEPRSMAATLIVLNKKN